VEGAAVKTTAPAAKLVRGRFGLLGGQTLVRLGPDVLEKRKDSVWSEHAPDLCERFLHVVHGAQCARADDSVRAVRRQSIEMLRAAREAQFIEICARYGLCVLGGVRLEAENLNIFPTRIQRGVWEESNSKLYNDGVLRGGHRTQTME
jgi:hypothetical protein